jgi:hypothetical protein
VSGEGFPYLGRSYRLLLVNRQDVPLRLEAGRFRLLRPEAGRGLAHFIQWYTEHGRTWLRRRVEGLAPALASNPERSKSATLATGGDHVGRAAS